MEVIDKRDLLPAFEQRCDGFALAVADLEREEAVRFQRAVGLRNKATIEVETIWAGEECDCRLVIADLRVEGGAIGIRDIGRVADDSVEALHAPLVQG